MRLARKLFLLAGMALATLAMTASSASAQIEVLTEPQADHCPAITAVGHNVSGGCHILFESTVDIPLHAYIPQKVTVSNCEVNLEGVIDENGEGYVTNATLDPPHAGAVPCTREACDEQIPDPHPTIPWPFHVVEHGAADEEVEAEFCLQGINTEGPGNWCHVHLEFTEIGDHAYELGHLDGPGDPTEVFCENNPGTGYTGPHALTPAPTSIEPHLETDPQGGHDAEIVH